MSRKPRSTAGSSHRSPQVSNVVSSPDEDEVAGIVITPPERIIEPDAGISKRQLAEYYAAVADWVTAHLAGRPLSLVRCPQGRQKQCFYQKHFTDTLPKAVRGVPIREKDGEDQYVVIDDIQGIVSLVQMGVLEFHPWGSTAEHVEQPDRLIFDLDPGEGVDWKIVVQTARDLADLLSELGLTSFVRTSGGKGLHIVVPIQRRAEWPAVREFTADVTWALIARAPERYARTMSKAERPGKIFVDYFRNQRGATAVASYSTRARSGFPVATPVTWEELSPKIQPNQWTIANLPARLKRLKKDPWERFFSIRQSLTSQILKAVKAARES